MKKSRQNVWAKKWDKYKALLNNMEQKDKVVTMYGIVCELQYFAHMNGGLSVEECRVLGSLLFELIRPNIEKDGNASYREDFNSNCDKLFNKSRKMIQYHVNGPRGK